MVRRGFLESLAVVIVAALVALLVASLAGSPGDRLEPRGTTNFGDLAADGQVVAGTYLQAGSYVTATTYSAAGTYQIAAYRPAVAVSDSAPITPTGTYQSLTASSAVTASATTGVVSGTVAGQLLWLVNTSPYTVTIPDDANTKLAGAAALTGTQTLLLFWDGADWLELARSAN